MLGLAPDVRIIDLGHDIPAARRAGRRAAARARGPVPARGLRSSSRSSTPAWAPSAASSAVEVDGRRAARPRQRPARPGGGDGRRRPHGVVARQSRLPAARARADLRRSRRPRPRRRPPGGRRCRSTTSVRRSTPPGSCPAWCRCPRCRRTARSSARCGGSTASATASSTSTPTSSAPARQRGPGGAGRGAAAGGEIRAARWVHTYADAKPSELVLLVDSYGLLSLALDRESAAAALGFKAGSGVTLVPEGSLSLTSADAERMRPGTTITIIVLLALIFAAALAQFVLQPRALIIGHSLRPGIPRPWPFASHWRASAVGAHSPRGARLGMSDPRPDVKRRGSAVRRRASELLARNERPGRRHPASQRVTSDQVIRP